MYVWLNNWELLFECLIVSTTDNASNIVAAFRSLDWLRISCFGHNLDLAISKALHNDRVKSALARCHRLVELFHHSWKKCRDHCEHQEFLGLPQQKLVGSVSTRWGSVYSMVMRVIEQQQAICAVLAADRQNWHLMPSDSDFAILETIVKVLEPVHTLTDALSGEREVTISAVGPIVNHIYKSM